MPDYTATARTVPCPSCGTPVEWNAHQRWRPFCSQRCRLIDLGQWLDGSHCITGDASTAAAADEDQRP